MIKIEMLRFDEKAQMPKRGSKMAAGYDLYANLEEALIIPPHTAIKVGTGIGMAIPEGYFGAVFARSGLASKMSLRPANCVGVIDADYRGEIFIPMHNDSAEPRKIEVGERIAQLVIMPFLEVEFVEADSLSETERGLSGFGSTGKL
ncbi:MAG: dUTP diphosphatase [Christensenellaceae bacterium]|nr:dUTP diphosphatase [Christensenellaceae bacterium]